MAGPSLIRRAYDYVAMIALLHVLALAGGITYVVGTGMIDGTKILRIGEVIRGDAPADPTGGDAAAVAEAIDATAAAQKQPDGMIDGGSETDTEVLRLEAARIRAELDQRLALNNAILLRVTTERESFQEERENAQRERQASTQRRRGEGFQKQLAIFESLSPKIAVEHLMAMEDMDEAAELVLQMDTSKAKKIVESARRGDQLQRMQAILQRVSESSPERSAELASDGGP